MKSMLLASTAVGVLIAALIIAFSKDEKSPRNSIKAAAKNAYNTMNAGIGGLERSTASNLS